MRVGGRRLPPPLSPACLLATVLAAFPTETTEKPKRPSSAAADTDTDADEEHSDIGFLPMLKGGSNTYGTYGIRN